MHSCSRSFLSSFSFSSSCSHLHPLQTDPSDLRPTDIQGEQQGAELQHSTVPIHEPGPPPASISTRLAQNAVGMLTHLVEYISVKT